MLDGIYSVKCHQDTTAVRIRDYPLTPVFPILKQVHIFTFLILNVF